MSQINYKLNKHLVTCALFRTKSCSLHGLSRSLSCSNYCKPYNYVKLIVNAIFLVYVINTF